MRHSSHLVSTAEALQYVFLPAYHATPIPTILPSSRLRTQLASAPNRSYATAPSDGAFNMAGRFVKASKLSKSESQRNRDESIRALRICVVQPDGKLGPPQAPSYVLRMIDRKVEFIEQLDVVDGVPVCKIMNKKDAREAVKARKKQKQPSAVTKYLELNWAIDKNDLAHRLGKLREFLEQGKRVEVLLLKKKKRMRDATTEEGRQTLASLGTFVKGIQGAKELRPMEGTFLGRATLFYEGKVQRSKEVDGKEQGKPTQEEIKGKTGVIEGEEGRQQEAVAREEPDSEPGTGESEEASTKQAAYG